MPRSWLISILALTMLVSCPDAARALPILPGNEHPHGVDDVTWPDGPLADPSHTLHQHWNNKELGRNFFEDSFFTLAAWDNRGEKTTYHIDPGLNPGGFGERNFGHGFIADRVLFRFDPDFPAPENLFEDRVTQAFGDWMTAVEDGFLKKLGKDPDGPEAVLGFNFEQQTLAAPGPPAGEEFINIKFQPKNGPNPFPDLDPTRDPETGGIVNIAGFWNFRTRELVFNTRDFTWYTGAAAPGANDQDFLTVARHEIGHVIGLGHPQDRHMRPDHSIMWAFIPDKGVRIAIDPGSVEGALVLYTQSVPSPSALILVLTGLMLVSRRFRRGGSVGPR